MKLSRIAVATALFTVVAGAQAATDGTLGATSEGSTVVTIIKENVVLLTDMDDININVPTAVTGDLTGTDDVCVFSSTGNYTVSVATDGLLEDASNTDPATNTIPFTLDWTVGGSTITPGAAPSATLAGNSAATDCAGANNATIDVTVSAADYNGALVGTYSDVVTVTVASI